MPAQGSAGEPALKCLVSALILLLLAGGPGCAVLKKHHPTPPAAAAPTPAPVVKQAGRQVGVVVLVNEDERFVLIDTGNLPAPAAGSALKTFSAGAESGVVSVGAVARHPFVVADIASGAPHKGDQVFQ